MDNTNFNTLCLVTSMLILSQWKEMMNEYFVRCKNGSSMHKLGFPVALVVKNLPANGGNVRDVDSIPGSGRSPGGGHSNPFQYSCLENPMDGGAK